MNQRDEITHRGRAVVVYTPTTRVLYSRQWEQIRASISRHAQIAAEIQVCDAAAVHQAMQEYRPDLLVSAGGDGTLNLCIQAVEPSDPLTVLPLGTANDLLRCLGRKPDRVHQVDRIRLNDRAFCTTGGFGIPGTIAQRVNRLRKSPVDWLCRKTGKHIYALVAADLVLRGSSPAQTVEIAWEDADSGAERHLTLKTNTLFVTNQSTFGGSLGVVSQSIHDDGHFEICVLKSQSRWRDLVIMGRIALAADQIERDCHVLRARAANITTTHPMPFFGDGEIIDTSRHFDLEISPGALNLLELDWDLDCATPT